MSDTGRCESTRDMASRAITCRCDMGSGLAGSDRAIVTGAAFDRRVVELTSNVTRLAGHGRVLSGQRKVCCEVVEESTGLLRISRKQHARPRGNEQRRRNDQPLRNFGRHELRHSTAPSPCSAAHAAVQPSPWPHHCPPCRNRFIGRRETFARSALMRRPAHRYVFDFHANLTIIVRLIRLRPFILDEVP